MISNLYQLDLSSAILSMNTDTLCGSTVFLHSPFSLKYDPTINACAFIKSDKFCSSTPDPTSMGSLTFSSFSVEICSGFAGSPVCEPVMITPSLRKNSAAFATSVRSKSCVIACELK